MNAAASLSRVRLLGGDVDVITPSEMLRLVDVFAAAGETAVVANHNAHSLFLLRRHPELQQFFQDADLVQIDSTPMIAWGRLLGLPIGRGNRSTYLDWRGEFWSLANARGWRVFYLGGAPGVAKAACERLAAQWPNVVLGSRDGYFDATPGARDNADVLSMIDGFQPDILFVGMGMPRQEQWILQNRDALKRGVIFSIGAAFDYEAGVQQTPPRWTGRFGVEWLFRLFSQPGRLAHRYLVEPWFLLPPALSDLEAALTSRR